MRICTIGFTQKSAEDFFARLRESGVKRVVDVRLNNVSQLAGFSKRDDLQFFLKAILGIDYIHLPMLAPTQEMLDEFKKNKGDWNVYEKQFLRLIENRQIDKNLSRQVIEDGCLLCSEDKPHRCHRRLVAEYLREKWGDVRIGSRVVFGEFAGKRSKPVGRGRRQRRRRDISIGRRRRIFPQLRQERPSGRCR